MANSNKKGASFERKIANKFSEIFATYTGNEKSFIRNPQGSGAYFGGKNNFRAKQVGANLLHTGDISTPMDFKFVVECKHYKDAPTIKGIITQKIAQWDKWISQNETDAKSSDRISMIIIKYNLIPEIVLIENSFKHSYLPVVGVYKNYNIHTMDDLEHCMATDAEFFFKKDK
jgi:hypothetical protein